MGYILGLGGPYYHDASACLVDENGSVVAFAEEERFSRRKHHKDSRSATLSAAWCLASQGLTWDDVDEVAVAWNPYWPALAEQLTDPSLIGELLDPRYFESRVPDRMTIVGHHLAHAASAFYLSGFPESAVLVADGSGDGTSTSLYHGTPAGLRLLRAYPFTQSLGWFYETVAEHVGLGDWTSAGKLMGLAAYGQPVHDLGFLRPGHDGGYLLDLSRYGLSPAADASDGYVNLEYYRALKRAYAAAYEDLGIPARHRRRQYNPATGRADADPSFTPFEANLAASAQAALERCLLALARTVLAATGSTRLCLSGGVGLNCAANGALYRDSGAKELFVQPAAGDAGCGMGAALECARRAGRLAIPGLPMTTAALGPAFSDDMIRATLEEWRLPYRYLGDGIAEPVADALADGSIAGWFQGPCEAGPRALGHRSILADPRTADSRDRVNCHVKHREPWRPLAPSILATALGKLTGGPGPADFMIVAYQATDHAQAVMPATVHVDGTLRPQAVRDETNPRFARLLSAFEAQTGLPALLNTSFNSEAEPIVCTPADALRTFFTTPLDILAIGGFLLEKDRQHQ